MFANSVTQFHWIRSSTKRAAATQIKIKIICVAFSVAFRETSKITGSANYKGTSSRLFGQSFSGFFSCFWVKSGGEKRKIMIFFGFPSSNCLLIRKWWPKVKHRDVVLIFGVRFDFVGYGRLIFRWFELFVVFFVGLESWMKIFRVLAC